MLDVALTALLLVAAVGATPAPLFQSDTLLDLELRGPVRRLLQDLESSDVHAFDVTAGGVTRPARVSAAGKSRRMVCEFPPLRLEMAPESDLHGGPLAGQTLLRITPQCSSGARSQADVVEEYLAYRILNLITDLSYRVRLLRISYVDTASVDESRVDYAFVTESEYHLAERLGGAVLRIEALPKKRLNEAHAARIYVFQYLIGNTDWSLVTATGDEHCCHNGQLIDIDTAILYVPYDFDISGLVNPRYARPDPSLRIGRVRERMYRGYCGPPELLRQAIAHVAGQRDAILDLYRQAPVLSTKEREQGIGYLERFFRSAKAPESLLKRFRRQCIG